MEVKKIDVKNERINNGSSAGDPLLEAVSLDPAASANLRED